MLNNPYPLTEDQQDNYKNLLNKALEFHGFNKNYSCGYYGKYNEDPGYLMIGENPSKPPNPKRKRTFDNMLCVFKQENLILYEYKKADFKNDNTGIIEEKEIVKINKIESLKKFEIFLYNWLISNENLTEEKRLAGKNLLLEILKLYGLDLNFRVDIYSYKVPSPFIYLREATQPGYIPDQEKKSRCKAMLQDLAQNKLITYEKSEPVFGGIDPDGTPGKQTLQVERIKEINLVELETFKKLLVSDRLFLKNILHASLKAYQLEGKYRLENYQKYFHLRSSTQNPPNETDQQNFQTSMTLLTEIGLIESKANIITQLDRSIINSYTQAEGRVLYDKEYAKLDFNPLTWLYIDYCSNKNLARDNPSLDTGCLDSVYRDPISVSTALGCPVVLPSSKDRVYNLDTILNLMSPIDNKLIGKDPFTRQAFKLSDIKPAPGGLKALENKITAIQNPEPHEEEQVAAGPSYRR